MAISPAEFVIRKFGGVRATARAIGRKPPTICKWRKPKSKGGTGGKIPSGAQFLVLAAAKKRGIEITAFDIIYGR